MDIEADREVEGKVADAVVVAGEGVAEASMPITHLLDEVGDVVNGEEPVSKAIIERAHDDNYVCTHISIKNDEIGNTILQRECL